MNDRSRPTAKEANVAPEAKTRLARRRALTVTVALAAVGMVALSGCAQIAALLPSPERTAGPSPSDLPATPDGTVEGFAQQQPNWADCGSGMLCADVYAPLDWDDPAGDTITLRMVKQPATGGTAIGSLFVNPGGPGASGVDYLMNGVGSAVQADVQREYDVIGWDPRGVGASSQVRCLDSAGMDEYLFGLPEDEDLVEGSDEWIAAAEQQTAEFGAACEQETGALLGSVGTDSTVRDLDMMRAIVGDAKLNYLGYSYGTYIGARYADAYPDRVGRLVLDGAMDPTTTISEVVREQTRGFELALRAYMTDCLSRSSCPFGGTVDSAMAKIGSIIDDVDAKPIQGSDGRWVTSGTLLTAIITPLYSQSSWGWLDRLFTSVSQGDADTALTLADFYYDREDGKYLSNSTEAFSAINCLDYPQGFDVAQMRANAAELDKIAPTIGRFQGYGELSCFGWPVSGVTERTPVQAAGAAPILVIGTTGDPATPYDWAVSLSQQLESGVLVTYQGEGHTAYGENACVNQTVDEYLLTGKTPAQDPQCS